MTGISKVKKAALALAGAFAAGTLAACGGAESAVEATTPAPAPSVVTVRTVTAEEREVHTIVRATGTLVADESSDVTPQVSGQVIETPVDVGDRVKTGQVLVRLDARDAGLKLRQAQASLQQAEAQARRAQTEADRNA